MKRRNLAVYSAEVRSMGVPEREEKKRNVIEMRYLRNVHVQGMVGKKTIC